MLGVCVFVGWGVDLISEGLGRSEIRENLGRSEKLKRVELLSLIFIKSYRGLFNPRIVCYRLVFSIKSR